MPCVQQTAPPGLPRRDKTGRRENSPSSSWYNPAEGAIFLPATAVVKVGIVNPAGVADADRHQGLGRMFHLAAATGREYNAGT